MTKPMRSSHPLLKILNASLIDLNSPSNISYMWNFGSLLGIFMAFQIITGLFLAIHFTAHVDFSFSVVSHISHDVMLGWLIRSLHSNGANLLFICLYLHLARGLYFNSFTLHMTWMSGVTLLLLMMMTTFLGYVLPWGQMSFWAATVITNLLSTIPYLGTTLVQWVWGGFAVDNSTLTRFFSLHFILPFILTLMIIVHLLFLHQTGSNNPLGIMNTPDKIPFHPHFSSKDLMGLIPLMIPFCILVMVYPSFSIDPENYIQANSLITPVRIQPEWYFLFAYAILRSIPNKLGGLIALIMSIMIMYLLPVLSFNSMKTSSFSIPSKLTFWTISITFLLLTWIGARPVEDPYIIIGQLLTLLYFFLIVLMPFTKKW